MGQKQQHLAYTCYWSKRVAVFEPSEQARLRHLLDLIVDFFRLFCDIMPAIELLDCGVHLFR